MADLRDFRELLVADVALMRGVAKVRDVAAALQRYWDDRDREGVSFGEELRRIAGLSADALLEVNAEVDRLVSGAGGDARIALSRYGGVDRSIHVALAAGGAGEVAVAMTAVGAAPRVALRELKGDRYVDFRLAGEGGMGVVYRALDTELNRHVAFKIIRQGAVGETPLVVTPPPAGTPAAETFDDMRARFLLEAWVTGGLEHPGVVPVYELGQTSIGMPYYTMRFVRGERTLAHAINAAKDADPEERLRLLEPFLKLCDTVRYAHSKGVIHRDVKPQNVALGEFGEVVLLDWGLATVRDRDDLESSAWQDRAQEFRETGDVKKRASALGTPGYMSPEAARGRMDEVDATSDVYSLGAVLYEILTGSVPVTAESYAEFYRRITTEDPPAAAVVAPGVPQELSDICAQALARDPKSRIPSAEALSEAIRTWQAKSAIDREVEGLLRDARAALTAAEGLGGDALIREVDLANAALSQVRARRPGSKRAVEYGARAGAFREQGIRQREEAARAATVRRVRRRLAVAGVAASVVLAAAAVVVSGVLNEQRKEAVLAMERAEEAQRAERVVLGRAENLINFVVGDLRDDLKRVGRLDMLRNATLRVQEYYKDVKDESPASLRHRAEAFGNIGDVYFGQGRLSDALEQYTRRTELLGRLSAQDRATPEWQEDLASAELAIGDVLVERAERTTALEHYGRAVEIRAVLAALPGANPKWRAGLVRAHLAAGEARQGPGDAKDDIAGALAAHGIAAELADAFAAEAPGDAERQALRATAHRALARTLRKNDELDRGLAQCDVAAGIVESLATANAADVEWKRERALVLLERGDLLDAQRKIDESVEAYSKALAIAEWLVLRDPTNTTWLEDEVRLHNRICIALRLRNDLEGAYSHARFQLDTQERLARQDPTNAMWLRGLAIAHQNVGDVLMAKRLKSEALAEKRRSVELFDELRRLDPGSGRWTWETGAAISAVAIVLEWMGDLDGALGQFRQCLEIREGLVASGGTGGRIRAGPATTLRDIGRVLEAKRDAAGARAAYRRALTEREKLAELDPSKLEDVASALSDLAGLAERSGDLDGAAGYLRGCVDVRERLGTAGRDEARLRSNLLHARREVVRVLTAKGDVAGAHAYLGTALQIARSIAEKAPDDLDAQRDLCSALDAFGRLCVARGQFRDALGAQREATGIVERLLRRRPLETGWRELLYRSRWAESHTLLALGDPDAADRSCAAALEIVGTYLAEHPDAAGWRADATALADLRADCAAALGDADRAVGLRREVLATARAQVADAPAGGSSGLAPGWELLDLAADLQLSGRPDEARPLAEEALTIARKRMRTAPEDHDTLRIVQRAHEAWTSLSLQRGDLDGALAAAGAMVAAAEDRVRIFPDDPVATESLSRANELLGGVEAARGEWGEAARHFRSAANSRAAVAQIRPEKLVEVKSLESRALGAELLAGGRPPQSVRDHYSIALVLPRGAANDAEAMRHAETAIADATLAADPDVVYNAACLAAVAARRDPSAAPAGPWRERAIEWLRLELSEREEAIASSGQARASVPDLDAMRERLRAHAVYARCQDRDLYALRGDPAFRSLFAKILTPVK